MRRTRRRLHLVLATALLALGAAGCRDANGPATPTAILAPQTQRFNGQVTAGQCARPIPGITPSTCVQRHDFTSVREGTLTATLTWTGTTDMDLVVTPTSCGTYDQYGCAIRAESRQLPASERVTLPITRGEALRFWVHNNSPTAGEYSLEVVVQ